MTNDFYGNFALGDNGGHITDDTRPATIEDANTTKPQLVAEITALQGKIEKMQGKACTLPAAYESMSQGELIAILNEASKQNNALEASAMQQNLGDGIAAITGFAALFTGQPIDVGGGHFFTPSMQHGIPQNFLAATTPNHNQAWILGA